LKPRARLFDPSSIISHFGAKILELVQNLQREFSLTYLGAPESSAHLDCSYESAPPIKH